MRKRGIPGEDDTLNAARSWWVPSEVPNLTTSCTSMSRKDSSLTRATKRLRVVLRPITWVVAHLVSLVTGIKDRKRQKEVLYRVIFETDTPAGKRFDVILICFILFSIVVTIVESIPWIRTSCHTLFLVAEWLTTLFFTAEYVLRLYCSPEPRKYALSVFGVIDFLATIPLYLMFFVTSAQYLIILRAFRLVRIFRVFKLFSFLSEGEQLIESLVASARKLLVFFLFILILCIAIGTLMFMFEGGRAGSEFRTIPDSIYWAIVTLTTVGYGDITPTTAVGRILSSLVMLLGYTIIAIPTGIVSVAMFRTVKGKKVLECPHCHTTDHKRSDRFCQHCGTPLIVPDEETDRITDALTGIPNEMSERFAEMKEEEKKHKNT